MASGPVEFVRNLGDSLAQIVEPQEPGERVRRVAQSAVAGIADELQRAAPELLQVLPELLARLAVVLERALAEPAGKPGGGDGAAWVEALAAASVRGISGQLRTEYPEAHDALADALALTRRAAQEHIADRARRSGEPVDLSERVGVIAASAVRGASEQVERSLPELQDELAGLAPAFGTFAAEAGESLIRVFARRSADALVVLELLSETTGRKVVEGAADELKRQLRADPEAGKAITRIASAAAREAGAGVARGAIDVLTHSRMLAPALVAGAAALVGIGWLLRR